MACDSSQKCLSARRTVLVRRVYERQGRKEIIERWRTKGNHIYKVGERVMLKKMFIYYSNMLFDEEGM